MSDFKLPPIPNVPKVPDINAGSQAWNNWSRQVDNWSRASDASMRQLNAQLKASDASMRQLNAQLDMQSRTIHNEPGRINARRQDNSGDWTVSVASDGPIGGKTTWVNDKDTYEPKSFHHTYPGDKSTPKRHFGVKDAINALVDRFKGR